MSARLKLKGKGFTFWVPLGDGAITPTKGGPNIEERERPGREALTIVNGQLLKEFDVPAFWDGLAEGRRQNIKPDVMEIVDLATDLPLRDFTAEGPMPYSGSRFVMGWPDWTKIVPHPSGNGFVQVELTLKLVEYNDPRAVRTHKKGHKRKGGSGDGGTRAPATIELPRPMNLVEVAAIFAGDASEAKRIGKVNGIHDIKKQLPKGRKITIPTDGGGGSGGS